jgi:hypothetical protein
MQAEEQLLFGASHPHRHGNAMSRHFRRHYPWRSHLPRCANSACQVRHRVWRKLWQRHWGVYVHEDWYCSPQCLDWALEKKLASHGNTPTTIAPVRHRIPLGLMMLSRGQLTNTQLRSALEAQRLQGGRLGDWLGKLGYATEQQITAALGLQWACPVLPLLSAGEMQYARMLPSCLLQHFRMWPIRFVAQTKMLYIAFSEKVDYGALQAIGQTLGCNTGACLATDGDMRCVLERLESERFNNEFLFESVSDPAEMARIAGGYVLKLGVRRVRMAFCGEHIWLRLQAGQEYTDLLFHRRNDDIHRTHTGPAQSQRVNNPRGHSQMFA